MGGCGGRGRRLRPETSQSGAGLGRLLVRGGAWPSGKAVAELCVALCQRQQLARRAGQARSIDGTKADRSISIRRYACGRTPTAAPMCTGPRPTPPPRGPRPAPKHAPCSRPPPPRLPPPLRRQETGHRHRRREPRRLLGLRAAHVPGGGHALRGGAGADRGGRHAHGAGGDDVREAQPHDGAHGRAPHAAHHGAARLPLPKRRRHPAAHAGGSGVRLRERDGRLPPRRCRA